MPLNAAREGHEYEPYIYEVCREKVREYAVATRVGGSAKAPGGGHSPTAAEVRDDAPSPTFAACVTGRVIPMVVDDPELDAHWSLLHTGQSFTFHRALRIGDVLRCRPRIAGLASRRAMDILTVHVDVHDERTGEPVLEATSTLVFFDRKAG